MPSIPDDILRLALAAVLGGLIGLEREFHGRFAGLRTHMMVSLGAAIFCLAGIQASADQPFNVTRVIQGVAAGVGFLGAGTILKLGDQLEIKGLTTASSIWLAAAVGTAAGLGQYLLACFAFAATLLTLFGVRPIDKWLGDRRSPLLPGDE